MIHRFMLEVPAGLEQEAVDVIESVPDAEALTVRRPDAPTPTHQVMEITVVAQSLAIIERLYEWLDTQDAALDIQLNLYQGDRYSLRAYDTDSLQQTIMDHPVEVEDPAPPAPVPRARGTNLIAEVPFGGSMIDAPVVAPAIREVELGQLDHVGLRVRNIARAESFYQSFFGMEVTYRAYREGDHWELLDRSFDWTESIHTGVTPEIVRMENGPVALALVNMGAGRILHENRIDHISIRVPQQTFNMLRGEALFHSFTVHEDTVAAFSFTDPFGLVWQLVPDGA